MYQGKKILIIDDSPLERQFLKNIVNVLGFTIMEAENGEDGVKMAFEYEPNLILMDVRLPGINGFQATKQIVNNEKLKNIPIIMCSSKKDESDKVWGARQGAKGYIIKPIDKQKLIEEINKLLS